MKNFALILAFISATVFAQGATLVRGDSLKRREYQTYSIATYYIDPTGNDTNACTASGTAACLTFAGVKAKLPRFIRNAITINVAAGTYSGGMDTSGLYAEVVGNNISVVGAQTNITPATGTASGTFTSVSSSTTDYSVVGDSTQSWTTDDLRGAFLTVAGVRYPIVYNLGTTISLATPLSPVPAIGAAYTITKPSVIFSTGASTTLLHNMSRNNSSAGIAFTDVELTSTTTTVSTTSDSPLSFTSCRIISTAVPIAQTSIGGSANGRTSLARTYVQGSSPQLQDPLITVGTAFKLTGFQLSIYVSRPGSTTAGSFWVEPTGGNGALNVIGPGTLFATTVFVKCNTGGSQYGLALGGGNQTNSVGLGQPNGGRLKTSNLNIQNCLTPVVMYGRDTYLTVTGTSILSGQSGASAQSIGLTLNNGAVAFFGSAIPTLTGAATDLSMDGVTSVTYATILASGTGALASPRRYTNASSGSSLTFFFTDPEPFFSFASSSGVGMGTACAGTVPTSVAGQTLSFVRASVAECYSNDGQTLTQLAINQPIISSGDVTSTQLGYWAEPSRTNRILQSRDLSNAAWTKSNMTCAKTATGMRNDVNGASTCTSSATNGTAIQALVLGAATRTGSLHIKRRTGTGVVSVTADNGATWSDITTTLSTTIWKRVVPVNAPGCYGGNCITVLPMVVETANPGLGIRLGTSADAVDIDFAQLEDGEGATSPILNAGAANTRSFTWLSGDLGGSTGIALNSNSFGFDTVGSFGLQAGAGAGLTGLVLSAVSATSYTGVNANWGYTWGWNYQSSWSCSEGNSAGTIFLPPTDLIGAPSGTGRSSCVNSSTVTGYAGINSMLPSSASSGTFGNVRYINIGGSNVGNSLGAVMKSVCVDSSLTRCTTNDPTIPGPLTGIVWIGDSITQGAQAGIRTPPASLSSLLGGSRYVYQGGISQARTSPVPGSYAGCTDTYTTSKNTNAQTLVWACGINDAIGGAVGTTFIAVAQSTLADARARGLKVIITGITPFGSAAGWSAAGQTRADAYNVAMAAWATANGATFVSTASMGSGSPLVLLPAYNSGDGLHPNGPGAVALATLVQAATP